MFEKAREFREKYYVVNAPVPVRKIDSGLNEANLILDKHAQRYARKAAQIKSEILVLEGEIAIIENDVEEFLLVYYMKFADMLAENGALSTQSQHLQNSFGANDNNIELFEKHSQAFKIELKNIYRKLVKVLHPDMNDDVINPKFYRVQNLYEKGDLCELLYIKSQLEGEGFAQENIINKIERLEAEIRLANKKLIKLIDKKSELISSAEYQLFVKFKLSEVRGYNFFDELLKKARVN